MTTTLLTIHELRLLLAQEEEKESGCAPTFADGKCCEECQMSNVDAPRWPSPNGELKIDIEHSLDHHRATGDTIAVT